MMKPSTMVRRVCLCAAALSFAIVDPAHIVHGKHGSALAQSASAEKEAFEAAKELGTVEAWDAFLSNYSTGFHADLARAYVKKLADQPQAPSPPPAPPAGAGNEFPAKAGSWGGIVRDGPGQSYRKVDSLEEGAPVTLLGRSDAFENGYPWFKIAYAGGGSGYQWGGILCSTGAERPDLYKTCTSAAERAEQKASAPRKCRENGGEWNGEECRTKVNNTGMSCKELKARCSRTDTNADCDVYLNSCTGHGDN